MTDEQKDLGSVMDKYGRTVNGIIASMLTSPSERDDIFQEVFLLYYTKDLYFEEEGARRSWLIRTAINLCKSANRSPWNRLRDGEEFDPRYGAVHRNRSRRQRTLAGFVQAEREIPHFAVSALL